MKIRSFVVKYDRIFVLILTGMLCVFVLLTALAFSWRGHDEFLGTFFKEEWGGSENHRLFPKRNGGFLWMSEENGNPVMVEMNQSGDVVQTFAESSDASLHIEGSYAAFQRGDFLFVTSLSLVDPESVDFCYSLAAMDLSQTSPIYWNEIVSQWRILSEQVDISSLISLTADQSGRFYLVNPREIGKLYSFQLDDLSEGELTRFQEFDLGERWIEKIISTPDGGLYLRGHDLSNDGLKEAVWWMDLAPDDDRLSEETVSEIAWADADSPDLLIFPTDFVTESLAVCNDGKLYSVQEDHTFTELDIPFSGSAAEICQTDSGTILVKSPDNQIREYDLQDLSQPAKVVFDGQKGEIISFASNRYDTMILLFYPDVGYSRILLSDVPVFQPEGPSSSGMSEPASSSWEESGGDSNPSEILSEPAGENSQISSGNLSVPNASSSQPSQSSNPETPKKIISDTFAIAKQGHMVVEPGTTVAKLKSTIQTGAGWLEVRRANGMLYSSGKLGTGMMIALYDPDGKQIDTVTIMVPGDLNGSATVNTRDESDLFEYLLGEKELEGVYWHAADYNQDGVVDILDLIQLKRYIG